MQISQQPQVAGLFYPADPTELTNNLSDFLTAAKADLPIPKAIIAPHAGYLYSGEIAANAYRCLMGSHYKKVVLLAPAHKLPFHGIASLNASHYHTPLGGIPIAESLVVEATSREFAQSLDLAFLNEHALEVQLPFLQTVLGDFELAPFIVGQTNPETICGLLEALSQDDDTLIVISSDLSHFQAYSVAQEIDQETADNIVAGRGEQLTCDDACGFIGIAGLIQYAARHHLQGQCIDLRNSGDTAGEKESVVGYGSFHFINSRQNSH